VLVYMNADNDLERFALQDLNEMMTVGSSSGFRIVVEVDRSPGYDNEPIGGLGDFAGTKRVLVQQGKLDQIEDLGEVDLAHPKALSDFLAWGVQKYPADRLAVVFWDHGGGWTGFGVDETTGQGELLTLPEIVTGLQQGLGSTRAALIGFDACLMAGYEVALTLAPFGDYFLASEDVEPGHGWDWHSFDLAKATPSTNPEQLGARLIADYRTHAQANDGDASVTLSLLDLREMAGLKTAIDGYASAVKSGGDATATALGRAREKARAFQSSSPDPQRSQFLYDLDDLVRQSSAIASSLSSAQAAVSAAVARAVRGNFAGSAQTGATGITVYFPPSSNLVRAGYGELTAAGNWRTLLGDVYGASSVVPTFTNANKVADTLLDGTKLNIQGTLAAGSANGLASASLFYGVHVGNFYYLLGDEPAAYDTATVGASWNFSSLTVFQGSVEAYGYSSFQASGSNYLLTVDFMYQADSSSSPVYAPRQIAFEVTQAGSRIISDTHYVQNGSTFGELVPKAGSALGPIVKRVEAGSGKIDYVYGGTTPFMATTGANGQPVFDVGLRFDPLGTGSSAIAGLDIRNSAGQGDVVSAEVLVP
jgi:hypothetical protein